MNKKVAAFIAFTMLSLSVLAVYYALTLSDRKATEIIDAANLEATEEYYENGDYYKAYSICNGTYENLRSAGFSETAINEKYPEVVELRDKAYDAYLVECIADVINYNEYYTPRYSASSNYSEALQLASHISDDDLREEHIESLIYLIKEEALEDYGYRLEYLSQMEEKENDN